MSDLASAASPSFSGLAEAIRECLQRVAAADWDLFQRTYESVTAAQNPKGAISRKKLGMLATY
jgi:hypothetical protein